MISLSLLTPKLLRLNYNILFYLMKLKVIILKYLYCTNKVKTDFVFSMMMVNNNETIMVGSWLAQELTCMRPTRNPLRFVVKSILHQISQVGVHCIYYLKEVKFLTLLRNPYCTQDETPLLLMRMRNKFNCARPLPWGYYHSTRLVSVESSSEIYISLCNAGIDKQFYSFDQPLQHLTIVHYKVSTFQFLPSVHIRPRSAVFRVK
jgi:hypothetical protein